MYIGTAAHVHAGVVVAVVAAFVVAAAAPPPPALTAGTTPAAAAAAPPVWMDASLPVDVRTAALLSAMTNEEKNAQLAYGTTKVTGINATRAVQDILAKHGVGGIGCDLPAQHCPQLMKSINAGLKAKMRLWIPPMQMCESTHSGGVSGSTLFPMPVVLGQSWNLSLIEEVGRQQGVQARAGGCSQALSPVLQVVVDPRFGRLAENYGEDPHLVSAAGLAALTGIQGHRNVGAHKNASMYIVDPVHHPFCQAKHYAGYGASAKDGYTSTMEQSERTVYEVFLAPWRELVSNGLRAVMVSHSEQHKSFAGPPHIMHVIKLCTSFDLWPPPCTRVVVSMETPH
jgi:beta-glucosidase